MEIKGDEYKAEDNLKIVASLHEEQNKGLKNSRD